MEILLTRSEQRSKVKVHLQFRSVPVVVSEYGNALEDIIRQCSPSWHFSELEDASLFASGTKTLSLEKLQ